MARDDEQVWAELVRNFHSSPAGERPQWPAAENVDTDAEAADQNPAADHGPTADHDEAAPGQDEAPATHGGPAPDRRQPTEHDPEEHFVPPSPPPIPRTDLITRLAWVCVLGTPLFFLLAVVVGRPISGLLGVLGAGAFIGGFVLLVMRLRGHDPYDPDDGAVV